MRTQLAVWRHRKAGQALCSVVATLSMLFLLSGCISTELTELPTLTPHRHPLVEKQVYRIHDPFTDATLGPDMGVRPRGFNVPRADTKRASEVYYGLNLPKFYPLPWPFSANPNLNGGRPILLQ